jgi:phenylacetate-coenzyme A ligase PaaK-like adenylate-forming protein
MDNRVVAGHLEFDFLPDADRAGIRRLQLVKLYHHAVRHPLVGGRLAALAGDFAEEAIEGLWSRIPVADAEDHGCHLCQDAAAIAGLSASACASIVFASGGTTGRPKLTWLAFEEVLTNARFHGKGYAVAGINHTDCVATFGLPGYLNSEFTVYHGLQTTGCRILPIGSVESPAAVVELIRTLQANVLLVMPSDLLPVLRHLADTDERLDGIRLVVTGGEALTPALETLIRGRVGDADLRFRSTFQTSEAGTIGFQCAACKAGEYHVHEELQLVELVARDAGHELVTTNLDRYLMPVIRQATGDLCEWLPGACACGRKTRRLRHVGRRPKQLKVGGEKLPLALLLEELLGRLRIPSSECAVVVDAGADGKDLIRIKLGAGALADPALVVSIQAELFAASAKLARQIQAGIVAPFSFERLTPQDLCFSSTGKRIMVRDIRAGGGPA